jgi:glucokinase-like ROK family protein
MPTTKQTVRDLRRINRRIVLRQLYFEGPLSRMELSQRSGLSPATVTNVVNELLVEGIFMENGFEESEGGRPRTLLNINPTYGYFIGVNVNETEVKLELFDLTLTKRAEVERFLTITANNAENLVEILVDNILEGLRTLQTITNIQDKKIIGIGIGVPGLVERSKEVLVSAPLWGWQPVPLITMLKKYIQIPIYVDNGAKAMALAEMWFGAGRGVESLAVLLLGTGVGAGIIANGTLYRGVSNSAGEWGHITMDLNGRECRCGSVGCLEAYVGAPAIIRRFQELAPHNNIIKQTKDQLTAIKSIVAAANQNEGAAKQVLKETSQYLGAGIANLINIFNPQRVILGGWVGLQIGELILPQLNIFIERYALKEALQAMNLQISQLNIDLVCQGAAAIALEDFFTTTDKFTSISYNVPKSLILVG